jgi:hypothetical protein
MSNTSPAESRTSEIAKGWLGILVVGGLAWYYFGGGLEKQADQDLYRIETKVAQDSVQEYEIANRHGSKIDICVHAGLVAAAYLQAKDESNLSEMEVCREERLRRGWNAGPIGDCWCWRIWIESPEARLKRSCYASPSMLVLPAQPHATPSSEGYLCPCLLPLLPSLGCEAEACRESR